MYFYLDVWKQMTNIQLLLLHGKTWIYLTVYKKWAQAF